MPSIRSAALPGVLVVDDEADILESLSMMLSHELPGVRVRTAISGPVGLEVLRREPMRLIIADYKMPGMDGLQFIQEARRLAPGVPTIMMTAFPDPQLAARAVKEYGVGLFIAKPFDLDYLVQVVRSFLDERPVKAR